MQSYGTTVGGDGNDDEDHHVETKGLLEDDDRHDNDHHNAQGTPLVNRRRSSRLSPEFVGPYKSHRVFRLLWGVMSCLATLVGVPMLVLRLYQIESEIRVYLVLIATLFVVLAVPIYPSTLSGVICSCE